MKMTRGCGENRNERVCHSSCLGGNSDYRFVSDYFSEDMNMSKKSHFHKRYNKLAVLYANAIIVNQDCIKEKISWQNGYKELEEQIADMKLLIGDLMEVNDELKLKLVEATPCADSNTD